MSEPRTHWWLLIIDSRTMTVTACCSFHQDPLEHYAKELESVLVLRQGVKAHSNTLPETHIFHSVDDTLKSGRKTTSTQGWESQTVQKHS